MKVGQKDQEKKNISAVEGIIHHFGDEAAKEKEQLLNKISRTPITDPNSIIRYHDSLLYLLAYSENKTLFEIAERELKRMADTVKEIFNRKNESKKTQLTNTGIANSRLNVSFSFDLVKWLEEKFPNDISIFSCDADEETIKGVFLAGLLRVEADRFREEEFSLEQIIAQLKPQTGISDLRWLLNFLNQIPVSREIRDHLYDSLKLFISISLSGNVPSLTNARSLPRKIFFHQDGLLKKFDAAKLIRDKKIKARSLSSNDKEEVIKTARMTLGALQRETDPVTYANAQEVELFDMGRGIDIALYPMIHEEKLSLESYIGYMAFKNRVPIAYGGGWIFLFQSKIGINIFPALRGGESSYLFCQILRLYHHHFNVKKFIVEPYQVGKNNPEGLKSGAYWFYYRLGFRSVKKEQQELADKEFQHMMEQKKYRPSLSIMKKLAASNLELNLAKKENYPEDSMESISELLTRYINEHHAGERNANEVSEMFRWKTDRSERDSILWLQSNSEFLNKIREQLIQLPKTSSRHRRS